MKLYTLIENTTSDPMLACEHGLSLYIEACGKKILFDTGETGAFIDNAKRMGVDLSKVELAILSHGHSDHSGGFLRFFTENDSAPVYLQKSALEDHYGSQGDYIGLAAELKTSDRLRFVAATCQIGEGLTLICGSDISPNRPIDSAGLTVYKDGTYIPDTFSHEQYLLIQEKGKRVLLSGCSHRGILNIAEHFRPDVLVGGFHFFKQLPDSPMVTDAANDLLSLPTVYYTGHCTGEEQYKTMKKIMADKVQYLSTGSVIEI